MFNSVLNQCSKIKRSQRVAVCSNCTYCYPHIAFTRSHFGETAKCDRFSPK
ncbi:hypothetical protein GNE10_31405 [Nostoc sp. 2RC]|nr:hypothetical protein [Nostoc sp. 2RC]